MTINFATTDPSPIRTDIIRIPADGPKPANTLVFLQCRASGADIGISSSDLVRFRVRFKTEYLIDGYLQSRRDWYLANTHVSATGMLRIVSTTTDFEFLFALDSLDPFIDYDGGIGFDAGFALQIDGVGLLVHDAEMDLTCNLCAYVLVYEPRTKMPPSGQQRQHWRRQPDETSFSHGVSARSATPSAPARLRFRRAARDTSG
jgi:hypothetical protein